MWKSGSTSSLWHLPSSTNSMMKSSSGVNWIISSKGILRYYSTIIKMLPYLQLRYIFNFFLSRFDINEDCFPPTVPHSLQWHPPMHTNDTWHLLVSQENHKSSWETAIFLTTDDTSVRSTITSTTQLPLLEMSHRLSLTSSIFSCIWFQGWSQISWINWGTVWWHTLQCSALFVI